MKMDDKTLDLLGKSVLLACIAGVAVYCGVALQKRISIKELAREGRAIEEIILPEKNSGEEKQCYEALIRQKSDECISYQEKLDEAQNELTACRVQLKNKKERLEEALTAIYRTKHALEGVQETLEPMLSCE
jgi:peptidoglycan hydrolase CwlO-like protein